MKKFTMTVAAILLVLSLSACANMDRGDAGLLAGSAAGGFIGHELTGNSALGTIGGAVGGAYLGHELAQ